MKNIILLLLLFSNAAKSQQRIYADSFFGKVSNSFEAENQRIADRATIADFKHIFTDTFANKVDSIYQAYFYMDQFKGKEKKGLKDSINNYVINSFSVSDYFRASSSSGRFDDFEFKKIFRDTQLLIYDITYAKGSSPVYYSRYWFCINGRWVMIDNMIDVVSSAYTEKKLFYYRAKKEN